MIDSFTIYLKEAASKTFARSPARRASDLPSMEYAFSWKKTMHSDVNFNIVGAEWQIQTVTEMFMQIYRCQNKEFRSLIENASFIQNYCPGT